MTTDLETRATKLRHAMADKLRESGAITSDAWHQAFRDVPRHVFVPRFIRNHVTADDDLETTIDVEQDTADQARQHLAAIGEHPTVATADGIAGYPDNGRYHRIIATCAPDLIPTAWLAQTLPAGRIVTRFRSGVLALTVHDRHHAAGHFTDYPAFFMRLRTGDEPDLAEVIRTARTAVGTQRPWALDPAEARTDMDFRLYLDLALPNVMYDRGPGIAYHPSGTWARFASDHVNEGGPWSLWERAETLHAKWNQLGAPRRQRLGISINRQQQWAWLDEPSYALEAKVLG